MGKSAHLALTVAVFLSGVAVGKRLGHGREPTRSYDREAAAIARDAKARSKGLSWLVNMVGEHGGDAADEISE